MAAIDQITQLYVGYYDRAPDPAGLNYWIGRSNAGMGLLDIAQSFSVQAESLSLYGFLAVSSAGSADAFLDSVYQNLFNRTIDVEGLNYWKGELASGKPVGRTIVDIISGAQGADRTIVDNKTSVSQFYVTRLVDSPGETFRLSEARLILEGVDARASSIIAAQTLVASLFAEDLTLTFNDPTGALAPFEAAISQSMHVAWDLWEMYFTRHAPIEIEISMMAGPAGRLATANVESIASNEIDPGRLVLQANIAYEITTGRDPNGTMPDGEIILGTDLSQFAFRAALNDPVAFDKYDAISVFAHEIGHLLGFNGRNGFSSNQINSFERYVSGFSNPVFTGPAALASNGGSPVLLKPGDLSHFADPADLMAATIIAGQVKPVSLLHIAILQDTGLPVSLLGIDGTA